MLKMRKRDRSRDGVGKSERSYIKHDIIKRVVGGQASAYRLKNPGTIAIIDGNAGDGLGVERPQLDMFGPNRSTTTAELAMRIADDIGNAVVILCEKLDDRRAALRSRFRDAIILDDNAKAMSAIPSNCKYAVWISDPCGPSDHGVDAMREVASAMRSDFVIAFNEGWISSRCAGLTGECENEVARRASRTMRDRYLPMIETPTWWADQLRRERLARTPIINGAQNFRYRVIVAANVLSDSARRRPFEEVL